MARGRPSAFCPPRSPSGFLGGGASLHSYSGGLLLARDPVPGTLPVFVSVLVSVLVELTVVPHDSCIAHTVAIARTHDRTASAFLWVIVVTSLWSLTPTYLSARMQWDPPDVRSPTSALSPFHPTQGMQGTGRGGVASTQTAKCNLSEQRKTYTILLCQSLSSYEMQEKGNKKEKPKRIPPRSSLEMSRRGEQ